MEEKDIEYLDNFEARLTEDMLRLCTSLGMLDGTLLESEDITSKWKELAPEYMADAVPNIKEFPEAAVGWAGYIGLAVAKWWDEDWGKHHNAKYSSLLGPRGFDDMDEHRDSRKDTVMLLPARDRQHKARKHRDTERARIPGFRPGHKGNVQDRGCHGTET